MSDARAPRAASQRCDEGRRHREQKERKFSCHALFEAVNVKFKVVPRSTMAPSSMGCTQASSHWGSLHPIDQSDWGSLQ